MRGTLALAAVTLGACLVLPSSGRVHQTVVMTENMTAWRIYQRQDGRDDMVIDGATVMSEEFYRDVDLRRTVVLTPSFMDSGVRSRLIIQIIYVDLPSKRPCRDSINMCELGKDRKCHLHLLHDFCGNIGKAFPSSQYGRPHVFETVSSGDGIRITFKTGRPTGRYHGFKFLVTSVSSTASCELNGLFRCNDGRCISPDLHCDGYTHCLDGTDEIKNCSRNNVIVPVSFCGMNDQSPLCNRRWGERWFGLAIPMAIVTVLLFFAIAVKVRKQLCQPIPLAGGSRDRLHASHRRDRTTQAVTLPQRPVIGPGWICPHERLSDQTLPPPEVDVGFMDAATLMLLPPPYSPPEDNQSHQYQPPTEGEPPPLYEDSLNHTLQSEKAVIMAPFEGQSSNCIRWQPDGMTSQPSPPAYQAIPHTVTVNSSGTTTLTSPAPGSATLCRSTLVVTSTGEITLVPSSGQMTVAQMGLISAGRGRSPTPSPQSPNGEFSL